MINFIVTEFTYFSKALQEKVNYLKITLNLKEYLMIKKIIQLIFTVLLLNTLFFPNNIPAYSKTKDSLENMQPYFSWWPSDAKPAPVKDNERDGYWWWPDAPGKGRRSLQHACRRRRPGCLSHCWRRCRCGANRNPGRARPAWVNLLLAEDRGS